VKVAPQLELLRAVTISMVEPTAPFATRSTANVQVIGSPDPRTGPGLASVLASVVPAKTTSAAARCSASERATHVQATDVAPPVAATRSAITAVRLIPSPYVAGAGATGGGSQRSDNRPSHDGHLAAQGKRFSW